MLTLLLLACAPDLPAGWEDATLIKDFSQNECVGDPYGEYTSTVTASLVGQGTEVTADQVPFRCAQDVEGYLRWEGPLAQILIQPVDMNPTAVAGCDCLYRLDMGLEEPADEVAVWRRWDNINDPNDPVEVGTAVVGGAE